jgi:CheY-like chemotaxis protein/anti-sigma regulatory factor (Ser/Thr protein kinase)
VPSVGLAVTGDVMRLTQVLSNVLSNAARYTEPGGDIYVTASARAGVVDVRVRDTGVGISAEMLPKVFDLFAQERQPLDRAPGGLGLGLSIVRSLVELHGGTIQAHSDGVGRGSEFTMRLPAAGAGERGPAHDRSTSAAARPARTGRRILVVDDNVDAARLTAEALEVVGHDTRVAFDGPAALQVAGTFRPEVALLDLGLPLMDGYELARQLVALEPGGGLLLIAVTGYGQASDHERTKAAGFHAHIVKPVDFAQLIDVLNGLPASERR